MQSVSSFDIHRGRRSDGGRPGLEKVLEAREITSDATRIRLAAFQLEGEAQSMVERQGPLET